MTYHDKAHRKEVLRYRRWEMLLALAGNSYLIEQVDRREVSPSYLIATADELIEALEEEEEREEREKGIATLLFVAISAVISTAIFFIGEYTYDKIKYSPQIKSVEVTVSQQTKEEK